LIVRASLALLDRWYAQAGERAALRGTHHLVASGHTSWHGFASAIFDEAHARGLLDRKPRVLPIATADYPTPARRPAWSVLDNGRLQQRLGLDLPDWREGLREVMDRLAG
jgi:dTDP-4-dehydrorhamnose reductase